MILIRRLFLILLFIAMNLPIFADMELRYPRFYEEHALPTDRVILHFEPPKESEDGRTRQDIGRLQPLPNGKYSLSIQAFDRATSEPLSDCTVHSVIFDPPERQEERENAGVSYDDADSAIGRLESQHANNGEGKCSYRDLPENYYRVQVVADGYIAEQQEVHLTQPLQSLRFHLTKQKSLKVRFVDGATSQPMQGLKLHFSIDPTSVPFNEKEPYYVFQLGSDGRFDASEIESEHCQISFPDSNAGTELLSNFRPDNLEWQAQAFQTPHYCLEPLNLDFSNGNLDLGTIAIPRAPIADILIVDSQGQPLGLFPFQLRYGTNGGNAWTLRTNESGRLRIPLAGLPLDSKVSIVAPIEGDSPQSVEAKTKPGTIVPITLYYKRRPNDVTLHFSFHDKNSGALIPNIHGAVSENAGDLASLITGFEFREGRARKFTAANGDVQIPCFTLSESVLNAEKEYAQKNSENPGDRNISYLRRNMRLLVFAEAPGYVPQSFEVPLEQIRAGGEIPLNLEPGATVTGRVLIRPGVPLTTATLTLAAKELGTKNPEVAPSRSNKFIPRIYFENRSVGGKVEISRQTYPGTVLANLDANGRFTTSRLRPSPDWSLHINTSDIFPDYKQRNIEIKPGMNDLGVVIIGEGGGELNLQVSDEAQQPVGGALLQFPLEEFSYRQKIESDASGVINLDLTPLTNGARQILRLTPPWGIDPPEQGQSEDQPNTRIVYDAQVELEKTKNQSLQAELYHGHTLQLTIPHDAAFDAVMQRYAKTENWMVEIPRQRRGREETKDQYAFVLAGYALQAKQPGIGGFVYHQQKAFSAGQPMTGDVTQLAIPNVPRGEFYLRLDGGFQITNTATMEKGGSPSYIQGTTPVAFAEIRMPDSDYATAIEISPRTLEIEMQNIPPNADGNGKLDYIVLIERSEPLSTVCGSEMRRIISNIASTTGKDPEMLQTPMLGYFDAFERFDVQEEKFKYTPIVIPGIPPGNYTVSAYSDPVQLSVRHPKTLFERQVEIRPSEPVIHLRIPYVEREPIN